MSGAAADGVIMRITVWRQSTDFLFLYRLGYPLWEAQCQGLVEVEFREAWEPSNAQASDVLVAQRMLNPVEIQAWMDAASQLPETTLRVLEYDDDLLRLRPNEIAQFGVDPREYAAVTGLVAEALRLADLVTVSTPYLGDQLARLTDAPVCVLPNTIQSVLLDQPAPVREPGQQLRVGWAGTSSHNEDWQHCRRGIHEGLTAARAELVLAGSDVSDIIRYPATVRPWAQEMGDYYATICDFHVMLAPLTDTPFNRSKSPLKALEAAGLGIPTIAADVTPYRDFVIPGETGFLCSTAAQWKRAITALANDEAMRAEMGRKAREVAAGYVTQTLAATLWTETYATALARKRAALPVG